MALFTAKLILAIAIVIVFETDLAESGIAAGSDTGTEFIVTSAMELLTLGCAFLALRLFKFQRVHSDLVLNKAQALRRWGVCRLSLLEGPMVVNTLLYYIYMNPTFGYMAIILALCLPFVVPTMGRCIAETTEEEEP